VAPETNGLERDRKDVAPPAFRRASRAGTQGWSGDESGIFRGHDLANDERRSVGDRAGHSFVTGTV